MMQFPLPPVRTVRRGRAGGLRFVLFLIVPFIFIDPARAQEFSVGRLLEGEWSGFMSAEVRGFPQKSADPRQYEHWNVSLSFEPEYYVDWQDGYQSLRIAPFLRVDQHDGRRTHFDVREALYWLAREKWELRIGIGKVYWGVTESLHLVDIVNQTDAVENLDGEDKLGQPMVNLAWITDEWGTLNVFLLPGFRERLFPGEEARLRFPLIVSKTALYASDLEQAHVDAAARWSAVLGEWDVGLSYFWGTSREPQLLTAPNPSDPLGPPILVPFYEPIHQVGFDAQWTHEAWLWKLESIGRFGQAHPVTGEGDAFAAVVGGVEYTFYGVFGTSADVGVLVEYLYDGRKNLAFTLFEDDFFSGVRLTLNDVQSTEFLAGAVVDRETGAAFVNVEASRRVGESWKVIVESRVFTGIRSTDPFNSFSREDYVEIDIERHF